jgi:hypothetical protein
MKEVLIVILIVGVIVGHGSATAGGGKYRDFIYLSPVVDEPDGRVVYDVAIKSHRATLTIEAIDCCLPGDKWLLVAKRKKPSRETQEVIFSGDGGYECYPIRFDKTISFPDGFREGRIIVKPVEVAVSYPASAFIKLSWNTGEVFTLTIIEGADYCLE